MFKYNAVSCKFWNILIIRDDDDDNDVDPL